MNMASDDDYMDDVGREDFEVILVDNSNVKIEKPRPQPLKI
jgi:hypothetical protein